MTTPDPIALPESGAKPYKCDYCGEYYGARACCGMRYDYLRHHGESILPPASALTPTPQVQGDMVLLPRRATPEMLADFWYTATGSTGGGFWLTKRQLARARKAYAAMLAAAPPLNELLGQPEEFNLNEVSGNPGQLASLEQRARATELLRLHAEPIPVAVEDGAWFMVREQDALDAITAALSAQPPSEAVAEPGAIRALVTAANAVLALYPADDGMWTLEQAVRPFNAAKPGECENGCPDNQVCDYCQFAAPQSREVRGVEELADRIADHLCEHEYDIGGRDELRRHIRDALTTTPQDAAGVETGCLPFETVSMVADALTILGGAVPEGGEEKAARADELVRTLCHEVGRLFSRARDGVGATSAVWDAFNALEDTPFGEHASAKHFIRPYLQGGDVLGWRLVDGMKVFGIVPASGLLPRQDFVRYDDHLAALTTPPPGVDVGKLRELVVQWRLAEDKATTDSTNATEDRDAYAYDYEREAYKNCADELAAAIDAAAPGTGKDSLQVGGAAPGVGNG
jgi:hypothetical protein